MKSQFSTRRVIGFDALGRVTVQGDRRGLGLRGSASSEFVPTLSQREEEQEAGRSSEQVAGSSERIVGRSSEQVAGRSSERVAGSSERVAGRSSAVKTESLTLNRLNGGPVSITIERHPQVRFQVHHKCVSINLLLLKTHYKRMVHVISSY